MQLTRPNKEQQHYFLSSMNSYLGILKHYQTYRLRYQILIDLWRLGFKQLILCVESKIMILDSIVYHDNLFYCKTSLIKNLSPFVYLSDCANKLVLKNRCIS
ncbi:MAG: hypothetical protein WAX77_10275 [Methylococcaceae bacterium]